MTISSDHVNRLLKSARKRFGAPCRVQFTAGWGCTVYEVFFLEVEGPQIPLERIVI